MSDSIYHMEFKLFNNLIFGVKMSAFYQIYAKFLGASFHNVIKICKPLVVYLF